MLSSEGFISHHCRLWQRSSGRSNVIPHRKADKTLSSLASHTKRNQAFYFLNRQERKTTVVPKQLQVRTVKKWNRYRRSRAIIRAEADQTSKQDAHIENLWVIAATNLAVHVSVGGGLGLMVVGIVVGVVAWEVNASRVVSRVGARVEEVNTTVIAAVNGRNIEVSVSVASLESDLGHNGCASAVAPVGWRDVELH
jgi:hypothetical protein